MRILEQGERGARVRSAVGRAGDYAIWLMSRCSGPRTRLHGKNIGAARHGDDAVEGAQVGRERAVVGLGAEDKLREALDRVRGFGGEEGADCGAGVVEEKLERLREGRFCACCCEGGLGLRVWDAVCGCGDRGMCGEVCVLFVVARGGLIGSLRVGKW